MRGKGLITLAVGWIAVVGIVPTSAHHAFSAEFDGNRPVTLRGKVVKMEWVNPHSWITMEVKRDNGKLERWDVEAGAPNALFRRGFRKDSLVPGTEIVIEGYQAKSGKNMANGRDITFTDGRKLFMGSSGTGAPYDKNKKPE
jgi:hypothetical protein